MKRLMNLCRNKWTSTRAGVHFKPNCNGQAVRAQAIDSAGEMCCQFIGNLGVQLEGTLPGKA